MITFENVTFSYKGSKQRVLNNFSLNIKKGESVWLSGASGKGKTTLLRLIMGLERVTKGNLKISDGAKISAVFQEDRLIPYVSVKKNISLFSSDAAATDLLSRLGIEECADMSVDELSGGMKRRVAVARALSREFDILILDEALNGLDAETAEKTAEVIKEKSRGKTVIFVTHNPEQAQMLCQRQINME